MAKRPANMKAWPAPVRGILRNKALVSAPAAAAEVLDNFICTAQGARVRGGSLFHATIGVAVEKLIPYRSGSAEVLFAASESAVYDVSASSTTAPSAEFSGQTSGDWAFTQFATAGGEFLFMVNGADDARHYNGTAWTTPTITGVSGADLSFVWAHKKRLWFSEKNTLSAWYLETNSIAGSATEFPLNGVFGLGGALLFGGTWSQDSGAGLDDVIVFVTTEGEVAVYQGVDPDTDFALVGVYRIGKPLHKNAWFRAGGDFAIVTEDGIISIAAALQQDRAALQTSSITYPIEDLWRDAIVGRTISSRFPVVVWPTQTLFIIGVPSTSGQFTAFAANTRTGAWSRILGWDIQSITIYQDRLYFGTAGGYVVRGDISGQDFTELDGVDSVTAGYIAHYAPKFQELGGVMDKFALHARAMWRSDVQERVLLGCFQNYAVGDLPTIQAINAAPVGKWGSSVKWGSGIKWGARAVRVAGSDWQSVSASGFSLAPVLAVGFDKTSTPQFELVSVHLRYEQATQI